MNRREKKERKATQRMQEYESSRFSEIWGVGGRGWGGKLGQHQCSCRIHLRSKLPECFSFVVGDKIRKTRRQC